MVEVKKLLKCLSKVVLKYTLGSMSRHKIQMKVVVIGEAGCGKTSLMNVFIHGKFTQQYRATIGADFSTKYVSVDDRMVTLQLWDTAGQDRFRALGTQFFRGSDGCVLVFDVTNKDSFDNVLRWREEFLRVCDPGVDNFPFMVLGNKSDLVGTRVVTRKQAEGLCREHGMIYFETSAKNGENVEQAFHALMKKSIALQDAQGIYTEDEMRSGANQFVLKARVDPAASSTSKTPCC